MIYLLSFSRLFEGRFVGKSMVEKYRSSDLDVFYPNGWTNLSPFVPLSAEKKSSEQKLNQ